MKILLPFIFSISLFAQYSNPPGAGGGSSAPALDVEFGSLCQATVGGFALSFVAGATQPSIAACPPVASTNITAWSRLDFPEGGTAVAMTRWIKLPATLPAAISVIVQISSGSASQQQLWRISSAYRASGDTFDPAFNTAQILGGTSITTSATANFGTDYTLSALTLTGAVANGYLMVKVERVSLDGADPSVVIGSIITMTVRGS